MTSDEGAPESDEAETSPVTVPHTALSSDLLRAVIESFVLREGTDYGERELSLEAKVGRVLRLLERGEACIVFDPRTDGVDVVPTNRGVPFVRGDPE